MENAAFPIRLGDCVNMTLNTGCNYLSLHLDWSRSPGLGIG